MKKLFQFVWLNFAITNVIIILPTNLISGISEKKEIINEKNKLWNMKQHSVRGKISHNFFNLCDYSSIIIQTIGKGILFGLMGPIGSYRIALGFHHYKNTENELYLSPVASLGCTSNSNYNKFIMQPLGDLSWKWKKYEL